MRRSVVALAILAILGSLWLARNSMPSPPRSRDTPSELQNVVSGLVANDPFVRNCVVSVVKGDGSLTWSGAAGIAHGQLPMSEETPIYVASVTKLYTATIVMILFERGALALDDPMAKYLPHALIDHIHFFAGTDYSNQVTLRQLLSHRSGIADYYTGTPANGKSVLEEFIADPERRWTVEEMIERARRELKPEFPPGDGTFYSDTNFQLLGRIIEAVTGEPLDIVFDEFLFRPLGLVHTHLVGHERQGRAASAPTADVFRNGTDITRVRSNGAYWADGGIVSTADEMNRFLIALKTGRLIRPETLAIMHDWHSWKFPIQYGLGTMYFALPSPLAALAGMPPMWGHSGTTGSFLYYVEDMDVFIAGSVDQTESRFRPFGLMRKIIGVLAHHETDKDASHGSLTSKSPAVR